MPSPTKVMTSFLKIHCIGEAVLVFQSGHQNDNEKQLFQKFEGEGESMEHAAIYY
jgi:hypothetical protein